MATSSRRGALLFWLAASIDRLRSAATVPSIKTRILSLIICPTARSPGIGPARSVEEINSGFGAHGDNERIAEDAFIDQVRYLWNVVIEIAAAP